MSVVRAFFDWIDGWNGPYELPILIAAVATLLSEAWMPWWRRLWRYIRKMIAFNRVSAEVASMPADERVLEVSACKDIRSHSSTRRSGGLLCYAAGFSAIGADAAVRETPIRPRCSGKGSHGTMMGPCCVVSKTDHWTPSSISGTIRPGYGLSTRQGFEPASDVARQPKPGRLQILDSRCP